MKGIKEKIISAAKRIRPLRMLIIVWLVVFIFVRCLLRYTFKGKQNKKIALATAAALVSALAAPAPGFLLADDASDISIKIQSSRGTDFAGVTCYVAHITNSADEAPYNVKISGDGVKLVGFYEDGKQLIESGDIKKAIKARSKASDKESEDEIPTELTRESGEIELGDYELEPGESVDLGIVLEDDFSVDEDAEISVAAEYEGEEESEEITLSDEQIENLLEDAQEDNADENEITDAENVDSEEPEAEASDVDTDENEADADDSEDAGAESTDSDDMDVESADSDDVGLEGNGADSDEPSMDEDTEDAEPVDDDEDSDETETAEDIENPEDAESVETLDEESFETDEDNEAISDEDAPETDEDDIESTESESADEESDSDDSEDETDSELDIVSVVVPTEFELKIFPQVDGCQIYSEDIVIQNKGTVPVNVDIEAVTITVDRQNIENPVICSSVPIDGNTNIYSVNNIRKEAYIDMEVENSKGGIFGCALWEGVTEHPLMLLRGDSPSLNVISDFIELQNSDENNDYAIIRFRGTIEKGSENLWETGDLKVRIDYDFVGD